MKLFLYKVMSLGVFLAGFLVLALLLDPTGWLMAGVDSAHGVSDTGAVAGIPLGVWAAALGLLLLLLGFYGLMPERSRGRTITFRADHGDVAIELLPIQKTLTRVIGALPEVRRIRVRVVPEKNARKVGIHARVVLQNCADQGMRHTAAVVSECIAQAVTTSLGLEDLVNVRLTVTGVHVDAAAAARRLHDEVDSRLDAANSRMSAALARPPMSAVSFDVAPAPPPERPAPEKPASVPNWTAEQETEEPLPPLELESSSSLEREREDRD